MPEYTKSLRYYKPTKEGRGCASQWQLSYKKDNKYNPWILFLTVAQQIADDKDGNSRFNWENGIIVKIGEADLGEFISVLEGRKPSLGSKGSLFHSTEDGSNKIIKLEQKDVGYSFSVSAQNSEKKNTGPYYHTITHGEASLLLILLKRAVEKIFDW